MSDKRIKTITDEYYTTAEVAQAVGRVPEHWCRIRHRYAAIFDLEVVKVGRSLLYKKEPVDRMIDRLLQDGDKEVLRGCEHDD
jgi:hypothetical protein